MLYNKLRLVPHWSFGFLFFFMSGWVGVAAGRPQTTLDLVLRPDTSLEQEMPAATRKALVIVLEKDQFLRLTIHQQGIDLRFRVFSPAGEQVFEVNTPNGTQGPESVGWIAETSGSYRIEIESTDEQTAPGRFTARIEAVRPATAADRVQAHNRLAAEAALQEANRLSQEERKGMGEQALAKFSEAIALFQAARDLAGEGTAHNRVGEVCESLNEYEKAIAAYQQARDCFNAAGDQGGVAQMLINQGVAWGEGPNRFDQDLECHFKALPLVRACSDRFTEGVALSNIGRVYLDRNEPRKALEYLVPCLALRREVGNRNGEVITLVNLGGAYNLLEEFEKALDYYFQARDRAKGLKNRNAESYALNNIGTIFGSLIRSQQALDYYCEALAIRRETKDLRGEFSTLISMAVMYANLKQEAKADETLQMALDLARSNRLVRLQAVVLREMSVRAYDRADFNQALASLQQALECYRQAKDVVGESKAQEGLGRVYTRLGEYEKAETCLNQRQAVCEKIENNEDLMYIYFAQAELCFRRGKLELGQSFIERSIQIGEATRLKYGAQDYRSYYFQKIEAVYELFIRILMNRHARNPQAGFDRQAFSVNEQAKARGLVDLLRQSRVDFRTAGTQDLFNREQDWNIKQAALGEKVSRLRLARAPEALVAATQKELDEATVQLRLVQVEIQRQNFKYHELANPGFLKVETVQHELLDGDTALLEYYLGTEKSYLWVVTQDSFETFELAGDAEINRAARRFLETFNPKALAARNLTKVPAGSSRLETDTIETARQLSRLVVEPAKAALKGKRLLVVPHQMLACVPFAALLLPQTEAATSNPKMLVDEYEIVLTPSIATIGTLRHSPEKRESPPQTIALFADPVYSKEDQRVKIVPVRQPRVLPAPTRAGSPHPFDWTEDAARTIYETNRLPLPRLPGTRREAEAITRLVPSSESTVLLDFAANRTNFEQLDLSRYRILHLATHGLMNPSQPEFSSLVLSLVDEQGQPQNGFLMMPDVFKLKLKADLVTLSACETGLGENLQGEGIVGFTRGFLYAGASRVMVSLWNVNDRATAELMTRFYQALLKEKLTPAAALRKAQLSLRAEKRWRAPYYWAAFQIQGEWK